MAPVYTFKLSFKAQKTDIKILNIDGLSPETYEIVIRLLGHK